MEVQVDRDAFFRGLQMAHNVVEPRQTLPILANVLLEAEGETRAADGDRSRGRRARDGAGQGDEAGDDHASRRAS